MNRFAIRVCALGAALCGASALVLSQGAPAPAPAAAGQAAAAPQQPAGRGGADNLAAGADFLKRPPVVRLAPEAQQKLFLLPEGYRIEPVLNDPLIQDPVGVTFDGNGRMYVLEMRTYMQDADGHELAYADQPDFPPRRHRRRRRLRQAHHLRRQHGHAPDCLSARRRRHPRARDRQPRSLQVHGHERRWRCRQEGTLLPGYRPGAEHRVAAWRNDLGARQLDLHHLQPVPAADHASGKILREETEPNGGQWWSAQDNYGKTWWVDGGGELGPVNIQARSLTARSTCRTISSRISRCRGLQLVASRTCRAACGGFDCPTAL